MNKLDSTQLEQLKAIGAYLYEVRQSQSRTLEEIAAKTYIPLRLLKALEAGQEQILPEPVFVQGFIRRYGDALGLDGLELAQAFPIQSVAEQEIKTDYADHSLSTLAPTATPNATAPEGFSMNRPQRSSMPFWAAGAIGLAGLAGLVYLLSRIGSPPAPVAEQSNVAAPASPSVSASPTSPTSLSSLPPLLLPPPPITASPTSPSPRSGAPVTVDVSLTADSWLEVTVDGEVELSETLPRGTKRRWSAEQAVTIVAGNAGGVQVVFNNAKAETMGALGSVAERTFTPKNQ